MFNIHILICTALPQELKVIKEKLKDLKLKRVKVSYFFYGMGNYNTIYNLTDYLNKSDIKFDFIISVGLCGYKSAIPDSIGNLSPNKNYIQIGRVFNLSNKKELIIPQFINFGQIQSIACSDLPVTDENIIGDESFVDMESYGTEFVLEKFKIPRVILKVPFDRIGKETINFDKELALKTLGESIDYEELIQKATKYINSYERVEDYLFIKNHFKLTFAEFEILKKEISKYEALNSKKFVDFFYENNNLSKKNFINKVVGYDYMA